MRSQGTLVVCTLVLYLVVIARATPEKNPKRQNAFKLRKNIKQFIEKQKDRCIGMMMNKGLKRNRAEKRCFGGYGYGFPGGYGGYGGYGYGFPGCDMMPGDWFGWGYPGFGWGGGFPGGWGGYGFGGFGGGRGGGCGGGCGCGGCCGGNCCGGFHCPHWICCAKEEGKEGEGGEGEGGGEGGAEVGGDQGGAEGGGEEGGEEGGDGQRDKPLADKGKPGQVSVQIKQVNPSPVITAPNTAANPKPV